MVSLRLFVAFEVPAPAIAVLSATIKPLRSLIAGARWSDPESWHVTVTFLGSTPQDRLPAVTRAVAAATSHSPAAVTRLTRLGAFPSPARAQVIWAGLDDADGRLEALAGAVAAALEPMGIAPEARPWRPHLTVARLKVPEPIGPAMASAAPLDCDPFPVNDLVLFRSHLRRDGAGYEALARFPLGS